MKLKSTCGPRAMLSRFTTKCVKHYASNCFNCLIVCPFSAKSGKHWEINAVMKTKNSNCVGILSDQGEAAT